MMVVRAFMEKKLKRNEIFVFSDKTFAKNWFLKSFLQTFFAKLNFEQKNQNNGSFKVFALPISTPDKAERKFFY